MKLHVLVTAMLAHEVAAAVLVSGPVCFASMVDEAFKWSAGLPVTTKQLVHQWFDHNILLAHTGSLIINFQSQRCTPKASDSAQQKPLKFLLHRSSQALRNLEGSHHPCHAPRPCVKFNRGNPQPNKMHNALTATRKTHTAGAKTTQPRTQPLE